jgi:hypothetical protein
MLNLVDAGARFGATCVARSSKGVHGLAWDPYIEAGLSGVGKCVASASARAYWAGGATIGPILALSYLAANAADAEPVEQATPTRAAAE